MYGNILILFISYFAVGGVFGVAIIGTVFNNELSKNLPDDVDPNVFKGGLNNVPAYVKPRIVNDFVSAFSVSFKVVAVMGALTLFSALFMKNSKPAREEKPDKKTKN